MPPHPESPIATLRPYLKYPERMELLILGSLDQINQMSAPDWPAWIQWWIQDGSLPFGSLPHVLKCPHYYHTQIEDTHTHRKEG